MSNKSEKDMTHPYYTPHQLKTVLAKRLKAAGYRVSSNRYKSSTEKVPQNVKAAQRVVDRYEAKVGRARRAFTKRVLARRDSLIAQAENMMVRGDDAEKILAVIEKLEAYADEMEKA